MFDGATPLLLLLAQTARRSPLHTAYQPRLRKLSRRALRGGTKGSFGLFANVRNLGLVHATAE